MNEQGKDPASRHIDSRGWDFCFIEGEIGGGRSGDKLGGKQRGVLTAGLGLFPSSLFSSVKWDKWTSPSACLDPVRKIGLSTGAWGRGWGGGEWGASLSVYPETPHSLLFFSSAPLTLCILPPPLP